MAQKVTIGSAVGRMPALNALKDQNAIIGLLKRIPAGSGGAPRPIPAPQRAGTASPELIAAITAFQAVHVEPRFRDGRVDPGGTTLARLNAVALDSASGFEVGIASEEDRNEEATRQHILRALRAYPTDSEQERLFNALSKLAAERNELGENRRPINCANRPLAYAEHYLFARWLVSQGSIVTWLGRWGIFQLMTRAVLGYDLVKLLNFGVSQLFVWEYVLPGFTDLRRKLMGLVLQTGKCPMSDNPPDRYSTEWGLRGSAAGLTQLNGDPTF